MRLIPRLGFTLLCVSSFVGVLEKRAFGADARLDGAPDAASDAAPAASLGSHDAATEEHASSKPQQPAENAYWERTDSFAQKMKLLEEAWRQNDFELARALTHSLRTTIIQAQDAEQPTDPPLVPSVQLQSVAALPEPWKAWAAGWQFFYSFTLAETAGIERRGEPVDATFSFPAARAASLRREVRLAQIVDGEIREVPCQLFDEVRRGAERVARLMWLAESKPLERRSYLLFFGNPDAELPNYPSDMTTTGEGVALDIENAHFKASLSRQTGQLERLTLKREHGLELFSGGEGHGEPPGIDWAHDYVTSGGFQKMRISLWDECPDYEVVRGPLCTIVRRYGFPYSPIHPLFSPSRLHVCVEYRFYSGLPWFHKLSAMKAVQSFELGALRDDEWVFSGHSFTDAVWMGRDGKLQIGEVDPNRQRDLWGVGFFNRTSKDSFIALYLEHAAEGIPELIHDGAPTLSYRWHGNLWSRNALPVNRLPTGAVLRQKNAYVSLPFTPAEGPAAVERLREQLVHPLAPAASATPVAESPLAPRVRLARPSEAGDSPISKRDLWSALHDCKDAQLYTADVSVVDLGLIYDVRVRGEVVTVEMAMPHRGRPLAGYFTHGSISVHPTPSVPIRERLMRVPGVRQVVVEQTWEPAWNVNLLTDAGRRKLGL